MLKLQELNLKNFSWISAADFVVWNYFTHSLSPAPTTHTHSIVLSLHNFCLNWHHKSSSKMDVFISLSLSLRIYLFSLLWIIFTRIHPTSAHTLAIFICVCFSVIIYKLRRWWCGKWWNFFLSLAQWIEMMDYACRKTLLWSWFSAEINLWVESSRYDADEEN